MSGDPKCAGCQRVFEPGDRYIEDTASGFIEEDNPVLDQMASLIYGTSDGKLRYCEDCTEPGGNYLFETFYGDEAPGRA